ncbi:Carnitine O-palmitoyltransferase 1, liver isoform [Geodia barretti]|nr:Carnitine O-palmitoyltransferase 1, liver isoform [Geodia barretti]
MEQIMEDSDAELRPGEEHLAALTAADRKSWAEMREKYFMTGVNRTSMEILEKAAFMIMFDDLEPSLYVENGDNTALTQYCKSLFHGNGYTRWFDKSVSVIIYKNGKVTFDLVCPWRLSL